MDRLLETKRQDILRIAMQHGAQQVRVFGSRARGEGRTDSDVDLLVEFEPQRSLLDQVALMRDLEVLLGCNVDIAEPEGLYWYIREQILQEAIPL
jgi:hypothetical protein